MASHTYYDYRENRYVTISHDSEEYRHLMSSGEYGGEVVESGRTVSPHVNTVPVQAQQETFTQAFRRGWEEGGATLHPWRKWANRIVTRGLGLILGGLVIMIPLPLIGVPMIILGYASAVVSLLMYLVYPFVLIVWENPNV